MQKEPLGFPMRCRVRSSIRQHRGDFASRENHLGHAFSICFNSRNDFLRK